MSEIHRITVVLVDEEWDGLRRSALRNLRRPQEEARWILREWLKGIALEEYQADEEDGEVDDGSK